MPIFISSRDEPRIDISGWPVVTYVTDFEAAMTGAKRSPGDEVSVYRAAVAQLALAAGVRDQLELRVVRVLPGRGRRLFDGRDPEHIELERVRVLGGEHGVAHPRYRLRHSRGA